MSHRDLQYIGLCDSADACFGYPHGPLRYMQQRIATGYYCKVCVEVLTDASSKTAHATQEDRSRFKRESVATERTKAAQTAQELRGKLVDALSVRLLKPNGMPKPLARSDSPAPLVPTSPVREDEADSAAEATSPTQEHGDEPGPPVTREEAGSEA